MTWFRRLRGDEQPPPREAAAPDDSPAALHARIEELARFVNSAAGRLPVAAVVGAREVTDLLAEFVDSASEAELDVYAVVQVNGIVGDYLPTTLQAYLALDPTVTERPGRNGRTPQQALREQVDSLVDAAGELLRASRAHDADALETQGNFLRTKFTRSDLDL